MDEVPWDKLLFGEDINCACAHNRLMVALMDLYKLDGNSRWLDVVGRMAEGRARILNWNEGRAWTFFYLNRHGWREDAGVSIDSQLDRHKPSETEPAYPDIWTNGLNVRGFARWYALSGDPRILKAADGIARFMMKAFTGQDPQGWPSMIAGREHGFWAGHLHMHVMGMIGLAVVETVETYTEKVYETQYTLRLKGNTVVDISPRGERPNRINEAADDGSRFPVLAGYPIYRRDHYKANRTPVKTVTRYISPRLI